MFPPIAGARIPSRSNTTDQVDSPSRRECERPSTKTPEVFKSFASLRNSFSEFSLRTPAACGFEIPVAEPFTVADDILNGLTRPSFMTRLENRRSASVASIILRSEELENGTLRRAIKLKQRCIKNAREFADEAQQLIIRIKDARLLKSTLIQIGSAESEVEVPEPIDKSLPTLEDLNRVMQINVKKLGEKRPSRADRVNAKLDVYRQDSDARDVLLKRTLDHKLFCGREILDRNIGFVRSLSPEVKRERMAQQASKRTEHRDFVLKQYTEMHEELQLRRLNEPHNRILRLKEEAKRAKVSHYVQVFSELCRTICCVLFVMDALHLIRAKRIRSHAELMILTWVRKWKIKKRMKSAYIIQKCYSKFHRRNVMLRQATDIVKYILKNTKLAIMAKNALDRMRGRMNEVRAHWRMNRAVRWFKYRIILYQLTMYDSERLRRVREQHKTTQEVMKEKAVSSISAIRNSGMSAAHQLQSAVATISNVSSFISIGTRFVHSFACYLLIFLCGSQKSQVHFEPAYLLVCSSFGALQSFQIFEKRFI